MGRPSAIRKSNIIGEIDNDGRAGALDGFDGLACGTS